jgi:putative DNA primase/helicase
LDGLDESNHYRLSQAIGALVVPMHDELGNVCGIQFIYPRGHKRREKIGRDKEFWPSGMAMGGTFGVIGPVMRDGVLLIAEGFATAASLFESCGQSVAYAFSANNLAKAGKLLRKKNPRLKLLFCADDDYLTDGNPGVTAATNATAEIELSAWMKPDFMQDGKDLRDGKKLTDFNDLAMLTGVPLTLANQVNAKLDTLKWRSHTPPAQAEPATQGGGGDGRRAAVSVMSLDDAVARFVPLDDGTGKYLFDTWTNKIAHRDQMIALLPAGMRGDDVKRHPVWMSRGAFYLDQVGFDPSGQDENVKLNTWKGWPVKPKEGGCGALLALLEYLCSAESNGREVYQWILRWMAYPLQNPGAKMSSALILHGPQGTGKSTVFQTLAKIYGDYATVLNQRGLEDRFNSDWADSKLFILAEEVVTRAEMWHIKNELKELVTGEWIRVNPKNIAAYRQRNQVNIVYLSNETQPLPIENDDRRHCVVWTPPMLEEEFYDDVFRELDAGGVQAFYHYLLNLDLGDFHPKKRPPMTQAKRNLIELSLPSEARFLNDWTGEDTEWPVVPCRTMDLYAAYLQWCKRNGEIRPRPSNQFLGYIAHLPGWEKKKSRVYQDYTYTGQTSAQWIMYPPPDVLQRVGREMKPGEQVSTWLTDCYLDFKNAGNGDEMAAA